ncbi:D-alanyl-lipoteichoic acid acyltransferase DltB (MBOAT superfamily) [Mucilaginibacter oryzae]|uniref:D-alanyl-lipoteichoic acid acyltransferase DltB (MBOAT superfamily) n=1 Tax=Mucilaginibacter oryzae TaxID=468058 RepID=A0A316HIA2_9SPHI|nr:MBOAT family O-acyltransferase [Mucilaginibacter oryzae]PWK79873.1 D-alanyl-lipoteichoic acid acyltransferase DltB (MBOAT superfamily) [Mucilaginibacter oryzae]
MLFNSLLFLLFFLIVTPVYYLLPHKARWGWLLAASCYFYMYFKPVYILIIFFTIVVDYIAGILIERSEGSKRKLFLILSLTANIGVLAFYKYFNFLAENINFIGSSFHAPEIPLLNFVLPIGLSFHTFQAMSYTIEVYRGNQQAERHLGIYSLYVMFYPQMVAGPIERPQHILPQLHRVNNYSTENLVTGIFLMLVGLLKKVVIADRLGLYVDPLFANLHAHSALDMIVGIFFFAFQIYCDFSGYSDIAVGAALTLGIRLMRNFNYPFTSTSITEYWRRWHISLSTWLSDYVFTPILINKRDWGKGAIYFALLVTFFISGLWHGAGWPFIIWGLLHAVAMCYEVYTKKRRGKLAKKLPPRLYQSLSVVFTFMYLLFAWIFFRAHTIQDAFFMLGHIVTFNNMSYTAAGLMSVKEIFYCLAIIIILMTGEKSLYKIEEWSIAKKVLASVMLLVLCYFLGVFNEAQFIYFQF